MTYPEVSATKRTDASFRSKANDEHHVGDSPLTGLSVDLVSQLPLDYMHLVCLGVVCRLILAWLKGPLNCRLPAKSVSDISERLGNFRSYVPSEFSRRPRAFSDIDRFKATEFRQLLLYTGVVAFRNILPIDCTVTSCFCFVLSIVAWAHGCVTHTVRMPTDCWSHLCNMQKRYMVQNFWFTMFTHLFI